MYKYTKRLSIGDYVCGSYTCHKYNYSYVTYECADIIIMGTHTVYTLNYIIKYKEGLHHQWVLLKVGFHNYDLQSAVWYYKYSVIVITYKIIIIIIIIIIINICTVTYVHIKFV